MVRMTPLPRSFMRWPSARARRMVPQTSTAHSSASFRSNGQRAASPVSVSAPGVGDEDVQAVPGRQAASARPAQPDSSRRSARATPARTPWAWHCAATSSARCRRAPAVNEHVGAGRGQLQGDRPADAAGRAGDQGAQPGQLAPGPRCARAPGGPAGRSSSSAIGALEHRMDHAGRDLGERLQHEQPVLQTRVRDKHARLALGAARAPGRRRARDRGPRCAGRSSRCGPGPGAARPPGAASGGRRRQATFRRRRRR